MYLDLLRALHSPRQLFDNPPHETNGISLWYYYLQHENSDQTLQSIDLLHARPFQLLLYNRLLCEMQDQELQYNNLRRERNGVAQLYYFLRYAY